MKILKLSLLTTILVFTTNTFASNFLKMTMLTSFLKIKKKNTRLKNQNYYSYNQNPQGNPNFKNRRQQHGYRNSNNHTVRQQ